MAKDKKSFILYTDILGLVEKLPDEIAGKLFKIIIDYVNDKNPIIEDLVLQIAFEPIKMQLKRDLEKWEEKSVKRSEIGKLGGEKSGEARRSKLNQNKANEPNALKSKQNEHVNVNVNVNDTVNVKEKEVLIFPFESLEFQNTWKVLCSQKKWKKKSQSSLQASLKLLSEFSEPIAIKMMENTIAGEWQGLFPIKNQGVQVSKMENLHTIMKDNSLTEYYKSIGE